MNISKCNIN